MVYSSNLVKTIMLVRVLFDSVYILSCGWVVLNVPQDPIAMSPVLIFVISSSISMAAGLASLARSTKISDQELTPRLIVSHVLNMGTCGAAISMLLYATLHPRDNLEWLIIGSVGLFSLGGLASIEWAVELGKNVIARFNRD